MGKGFKIFLVILLSIIAIALSGILALLIMRSPSTGFVFSFGDSMYSENLIEEETFEQIKKFASSKLVITDRLHGMIFAVILRLEKVFYVKRLFQIIMK